MHDQILICLYFLRENESRECLVYNRMSFHEVLTSLQIKDADNRMIVEKTSGFLCDPDVSMQSLNVQNCMKFMIY